MGCDTRGKSILLCLWLPRTGHACQPIGNAPLGLPGTCYRRWLFCHCSQAGAPRRVLPVVRRSGPLGFERTETLRLASLVALCIAQPVRFGLKQRLHCPRSQTIKTDAVLCRGGRVRGGATASRRPKALLAQLLCKPQPGPVLNATFEQPGDASIIRGLFSLPPQIRHLDRQARLDAEVIYGGANAVFVVPRGHAGGPRPAGPGHEARRIRAPNSAVLRMPKNRAAARIYV